jgi:hypothetical protein
MRTGDEGQSERIYDSKTLVVGTAARSMRASRGAQASASFNSSRIGQTSELPAVVAAMCAAGLSRNGRTESKGKTKPMHRIKVATIAVLGMAALAGCASQPAPAPVTTANLGATEGRITFTGGAVALGVGFQWGNGTLTYQGGEYPFRLNGLSVVDIGVTRVTGTGTVHNLRNVADFNGNYVSISAGATIAGGGSVTSLRNQNGVVIDGVSTAQGVRLTLAPGGVNVRLLGQQAP